MLFAAAASLQFLVAPRCPRISAVSPADASWLAPLLTDEVLTEARWAAAQQELEGVDMEAEAPLTYGEFDLHEFHAVLDLAVSACGRLTRDLTFCDLG